MKDLNLIRKIAWKFYHSNSGKIEFEELFAEASLAYSVALLTYNGNGSSAYFYRCISNHLIDFCKKESFYAYRNEKTILQENTYEMQTPYEELHKELPEDCKKIATLILKNSKDIPEASPKKMRGFVVKVLRENNWSWSSIWKGFADFKMALNHY